MAKKEVKTISYEQLKKELRQGEVRPIYLLHGVEGYYVDELVKCFEALVPDEDKDFGLSILYAPQIEPPAVIDICRQLPMMTDRQVVILKEAQAVKKEYLESLTRYAQSPTPTTVLVVAARGDDVKAEKFKNAVDAAGGSVYQSKKLYDNQIPALVGSYIKEKGLRAEPKSLEMLRDFIGTELSRLYNEIDKLAEILGAGATVTPEAIERNIGVSKDYNSYELIDAVAARDIARIYRIVDYFTANPRQNPLPPIAAALFNFFADLLQAYYAADKSDRGLMGELDLKYQFAVNRIRIGMSNYNAFQVVDALSEIRRFDAKSKGVGSRQDGYMLLKDLVFRLVTTTGK